MSVRCKHGYVIKESFWECPDCAREEEEELERERREKDMDKIKKDLDEIKRKLNR